MGDIDKEKYGGALQAIKNTADAVIRIEEKLDKQAEQTRKEFAKRDKHIDSLNNWRSHVMGALKMLTIIGGIVVVLAGIAVAVWI